MSKTNVEMEHMVRPTLVWAHFKKGGIFLALKGLHIPAQGNALGYY
jgi:hypothetical protein